MRVRLIRPTYWTDVDLQTRLSAEVREFYIGCWMEADDAGYIAWDIDRIGADLYPYRSLPWRRKRLAEWAVLLGCSHLEVLSCGIHAFIPNLKKHQAPPKPSYQNQRAHGACGAHVAPVGERDQMAPDGTNGDQMAPAQGFSREGGLKGEGREGKKRGAPPRELRNDDEGGELREAMRRRGLPVDVGGAA